ncbi:hypothetical protein QUB70_06895, partial [Microcoleus sp. A003_D6]
YIVQIKVHDSKCIVCYIIHHKVRRAIFSKCLDRLSPTGTTANIRICLLCDSFLDNLRAN